MDQEQIETPQDEIIENAAADTPETNEPSAAEALLDSITEGVDADDSAAEAPVEELKDEAKEEPAAPEQPEQPVNDEEALAEIKNPRSRNRFQELLRQKEEKDLELQQVKGDMDGLRAAITETGMDATQFAQTLQFAKLANSNDPKNLKIARDILTEQLASISMRLGEEAPGVDLLQNYPDLKQGVSDMALTREHAIEIAKSRHMQAQQMAQAQQAQQAQQVHQQSVAAIQNAQQHMLNYFSTREQEVDHPARMVVLSKYFSDPAKMQEFVSTYQPDQWLQALRWMYDNVQVQAAPQPKAPQPLRSRASAMGSPAPSSQDPIARMAQTLDSMGI